MHNFHKNGWFETNFCHFFVNFWTKKLEFFQSCSNIPVHKVGTLAHFSNVNIFKGSGIGFLTDRAAGGLSVEPW